MTDPKDARIRELHSLLCKANRELEDYRSAFGEIARHTGTEDIIDNKPRVAANVGALCQKLREQTSAIANGETFKECVAEALGMNKSLPPDMFLTRLKDEMADRKALYARLAKRTSDWEDAAAGLKHWKARAEELEKTVAPAPTPKPLSSISDLLESLHLSNAAARCLAAFDAPSKYEDGSHVPLAERLLWLERQAPRLKSGSKVAPALADVPLIWRK